MNIIVVSIALVSAACMVVAIGWLWRIRLRERQRVAARIEVLSAAIDGRQTEFPADGDRGPAYGAVPMRAAAAIALTLGLIVAVATATRDLDPQPPAAPALQLMAMDHSRNGDTLTVSGLVRSTRTGRDFERVNAVVSGFDHNGNVVASAMSALDDATLRSGAESRFVVGLPGASAIERYRVTFHTEHGLVRHTDRRADRIRVAAAGSLDNRSHR